MKARKLKEILNNTGYTVAFYGDYIGVGSPLCHDLIKLEVETNKITYALDAFHKGRSAIGSAELTFIWDKLHELVNNGGIKDIINGSDVIDNPLPVYTVRHGALLCTVTDAYGWPNVTVEGYMMHDNTYFKTAIEAIEYGIKEHEYRFTNLSERIVELKQEVDRLEFVKQDCINIINGLKLLTPSGKADVNYNMNNNIDPKEGQEEVKQPADAQPAEQATEESAEEGGEEGGEG